MCYKYLKKKRKKKIVDISYPACTHIFPDKKKEKERNNTERSI